MGENKEKAVVDIYVDGQLRVGGQENMESDKRYSTILLDGEENKEHEFKVVVTSGQLTIDGVYILGDPVPGGGTEALKALVTECSGLYSGDYTSETWTVFEKTLQKAQEILEKEDAVQMQNFAAPGTDCCGWMKLWRSQIQNFRNTWQSLLGMNRRICLKR